MLGNLQESCLKGDPKKNVVCIQSSVRSERFGDVVETIFHPQCHASTNVKVDACTCLKNSSEMLISNKIGMVTLQPFASGVITQTRPAEEKQGTPSFLDGLEKDITIEAKKIEIMLLADIIVRKVSFEF